MTTELELHDLVREALRAISKVASEAEADDIRIRYLGRKGGRLTEVTKSLKDLPPEQKRVVGPVANRLKGLIEKALAAYKQGDMAAIREAIESEIQNEGGKLLLFGLVEVSGDSSNFEEAGTVSGPRVDLTVPGRSQPLGHKHPLIQTMEDIVEVLSRLGYTVAEGPEIELDSYNFEALNIPRDHPARDMQDTFYISDDVLLRTHTSPVQYG